MGTTAMTLDINTTQAYQALCGFLAHQLYDSPRQDTLRKLVEQRELLLEDPFYAVNATASQALYDELSAAAHEDGGEAGKGTLLAALRQDYTFLFKMVGVSHTSPYESVYRTDDRTVFGSTTFEVRAAYEAFGLAVTEQGREPEDHIGLELLFMEQLFEKLARQSEQGDTRQAAATLKALRSFLEEHLLVFGSALFQNIQVQAQSAYFKAVAALGESVLASLGSLLEARPKAEAKPEPKAATNKVASET